MSWPVSVQYGEHLDLVVFCRTVIIGTHDKRSKLSGLKAALQHIFKITEG